MSKTDSDMFEYYAMLEIDRIDSILSKYGEPDDHLQPQPMSDVPVLDLTR